MAQFIKMKYFQNSKLSFQSRHRHHLSKIKIYFPDVLEQLDDEQGIRPQDPGRHEVANHADCCIKCESAFSVSSNLRKHLCYW